MTHDHQSLRRSSRRALVGVAAVLLATTASGLALAGAVAGATNGPATSASSHETLRKGGFGPDQRVSRDVEGLAVLSNGQSVAFGNGKWIVTRRADGASAWGRTRSELIYESCQPRPDLSAASRRTLISVRGCAAGKAFGHQIAAAWTKRDGWSEDPGRKDGGRAWVGTDGRVGVGRDTFTPRGGWSTLPAPAHSLVDLAAGNGGQIVAATREGVRDERGSYIETYLPGSGWTNAVMIGMPRGSHHVDVDVAPSGAAVVSGLFRGKLRAFRRAPGSEQWRSTTLAVNVKDVPVVGIAGDGTVHAAFVHGARAQQRVLARTWRPNGTRGHVRRISRGTTNVRLFQGATGLQGAQVVVWTGGGTTESPTYSARASTSRASGQWARQTNLRVVGPISAAIGPDSCAVVAVGVHTRTRGSCARR